MKNREAELADAKDQAAELFSNLRRMVDSMSIGIIVLDADLKTEIINQAFYDLWADRPGEGAGGVDIPPIYGGQPGRGRPRRRAMPNGKRTSRTREAEFGPGGRALARAGALRWPRHDLHDGAAVRRQACSSPMSTSRR